MPHPVSPSQASLRVAWRAHQDGRLETAERLYHGCLDVAPHNSQAWFALGLLHSDRGDYRQAATSYRRALHLNPKYVRAWTSLSNALALLDCCEDAEEAARRAIACSPESHLAQLNLGCALARQARWEEAETAFRHSLRTAPSRSADRALARTNLGMLQLLRGEFQAGWRRFESRRYDHAPPVDAERWRGETLRGRRLLLQTEQGVGDSVMFARFFQTLQAKGAELVVLAPRRLIPLLQRVTAVRPIVFIVKGKRAPEVDCWSPLMSVPRYLRIESDGEIPSRANYLTAEPARVERVRARLNQTNPRLRIGVAWSGNAANDWDCVRSASLGDLAPLKEIDGAEFWSLQEVEQQVGRVSARANSGSSLPHRVRPGDPTSLPLLSLDSGADRDGAFLDTAALISQLDAVVSVDTAAAHVSAALGAPTRIALATTPDWRWRLQREDSAWYPSMRLVRQRTPGGWRDVFSRIASELR